MMENFIYTVEKVKSEEVPHNYLILADGPSHFRSLLKSVKGSIQSVSSLDDNMELLTPKEMKGKKNIYRVLILAYDAKEFLVIANSIEEVLDQVLEYASYNYGIYKLESIELYSDGVEVLM